MKCKLNIMGMCHPYAISLRNGVWPRETTLRVAFCCSCPVGSFPHSRTQAIEEDFCGQYSSTDVYTARVVGATCNCIPASGDANLQCQDYTFTTGSTSVVDVEVVNRTRLDGRSCRLPSSNEVATCSAQATSLAGSGKPYGTDTIN